jgi:hypothetical protein
MSMYLGMTEEDYDNVIKRVPLNIADRLGIQNASMLTAEVLKQEIKHSEPIAFGLMEAFLATYQAWWQKSKEVGETESPAPDAKDQMLALIDQRDEIRRALLSYLNYARPKPAVGS